MLADDERVQVVLAEHPLGVGGMDVHKWHLGDITDSADVAAREWLMRPRGAYVMGRNMFGPVRGGWANRARTSRPPRSPHRPGEECCSARASASSTTSATRA